MEQPTRPVLLWDGDCGFCGRMVDRLRKRTGDRVEYLRYQERGERFRSIPDAELAKAVYLVDTDGTQYRGAEAAWRALALANGHRKKRPLQWYQKSRSFRRLSDAGYRWVARNRGWLSKFF